MARAAGLVALIALTVTAETMREAPVEAPTGGIAVQHEESEDLPTRPGRIALAATVVALALAALRCSVDVPLGVDPRFDAADNNVDAGAGD
jgi:hypothetical protein